MYRGICIYIYIYICIQQDHQGRMFLGRGLDRRLMRGFRDPTKFLALSNQKPHIIYIYIYTQYIYIYIYIYIYRHIQIVYIARNLTLNPEGDFWRGLLQMCLSLRDLGDHVQILTVKKDPPLARSLQHAFYDPCVCGFPSAGESPRVISCLQAFYLLYISLLLHLSY